MIKRADIKDLSVLIKIEESCFTPLERFSRDIYLEYILSPYSEVFLECEENKVIGSLVLLKFEDCLYIASIAVLPEFRMKGYGKKLIQFCEEGSKKLGLSRVELHVKISNKIAILFYEKMGYKRVCVEENYYINEDAYRYVKFLR